MNTIKFTSFCIIIIILVIVVSLIKTLSLRRKNKNKVINDSIRAPNYVMASTTLSRQEILERFYVVDNSISPKVNINEYIRICSTLSYLPAYEFICIYINFYDEEKILTLKIIVDENQEITIYKPVMDEKIKI